MALPQFPGSSAVYVDSLFKQTKQDEETQGSNALGTTPVGGGGESGAQYAANGVASPEVNGVDA